MPILIKGGGGGKTPSGTRNITANGTYDVADYASAKVAVPEPSGTKTITENGTHDVKSYASVAVDVSTESSDKLRIIPVDHIVTMGETVVRYTWFQELYRQGLTAADIKQVRLLYGYFRETGSLEVGYDVLYDKEYASVGGDYFRKVQSVNLDGGYTRTGYISSVAFDGDYCTVYLESGVLYDGANSFDYAHGAVVVELY